MNPIAVYLSPLLLLLPVLPCGHSFVPLSPSPIIVPSRVFTTTTTALAASKLDPPKIHTNKKNGNNTGDASNNHDDATKDKDSTNINKNMDQYIQITNEEYFDGLKPDSSWNLAAANFERQSKTIIQQIEETFGLKERDALKPPNCLGLTLNNQAVKEAEERRIASGRGVETHPVSLALYELGCALLDTLFDGRPIQLFWVLETIARVPYFSFVSMLHLYESFGWWRAVELRKVHNAEEWNELHHLLIMESLGGNALWSDRFLGYHAALFFYWALIVVFFCSPRIAYNFMTLLEYHAVDTYGTFCRENKERLAQLPPPQVAVSYYRTGDLYLFDDFQVSRTPGSRRPPCDNLLDVFKNIRDDEWEHVKTMKACQNYADRGTKIVSPHLKTPQNTAGERIILSPEQKRELWKEWSEQINSKNGKGDDEKADP